MPINITIDGSPVAQSRPRFSTASGYARAYDPAKSRNYKDYIRLAASQQMNGQAPLQGALSLSVRVYRATPKSMSAKKAKQAEAGQVRPTTKPDVSNYIKGIEDALNGIVWQDDSQIVAYHEPFGKWYSDRPRIEVEVKKLDERTD